MTIKINKQAFLAIIWREHDFITITRKCSDALLLELSALNPLSKSLTP